MAEEGGQHGFLGFAADPPTADSVQDLEWGILSLSCRYALLGLAVGTEALAAVNLTLRKVFVIYD